MRAFPRGSGSASRLSGAACPRPSAAMSYTWERGNLITIGIVTPSGRGRFTSTGGPLAKLSLFGASGLVGQPIEVGRKRQQGVAIVRRAGFAGSLAQLIGATVIILCGSQQGHDQSLSCKGPVCERLCAALPSLAAGEISHHLREGAYLSNACVRVVSSKYPGRCTRFAGLVKKHKRPEAARRQLPRSGTTDPARGKRGGWRPSDVPAGARWAAASSWRFRSRAAEASASPATVIWASIAASERAI